MENEIVKISTGSIQSYLHEILAVFHQTKSTENSYYPALEQFLNQIILLPNKRILVNPREEWGLPDIIIQDGEIIIGYVECKAPNTNLDEIIKSEQIQRYFDAFPSLCVTNFIEFVFIKQNQPEPIKIRLESTNSLENSKIETTSKKISKEFNDAMLDFVTFKSPPIKDSKKFSLRLSKLTRVMKSILDRYYQDDTQDFSEKAIQELYLGFKEALIQNLRGDEFSDTLAQTLTFSLLLAWTQEINKGNFGISSAWDEIPKSIPVLIEIFSRFMVQMPDDVKLCCNNIIQLISQSDFDNIFKNFGIDDNDPSLTFYEDFLQAYNPEMRKLKGIYYTPRRIVKFIVTSVNLLVKRSFNREEGIMDSGVQLLDPCAGTLTFIIESIRLIFNELNATRDSGRFKSIVQEHILKNFYAFEIMVAPYAVGHFKIRELLKNLGVQLGKTDSLKLYLTNTLDMKPEISQVGFPALAEEGKKANIVKRDTPILIIFGNPPYRIGSTNKTVLLDGEVGKTGLMKDYLPKREKNMENLEPLSDDYIKFIRFAQWKIAENPPNEGIIGFITNNNFLRGRIHRQMRLSLLQAFDEILIYDLHGDAREEEPPVGSANESVFGIQTGVCISFFIKIKHNGAKQNSKKLADVYYGEIWGTEDEKLKTLEDTSILDFLEQGQLKKLEPFPPYYFLQPYDVSEDQIKIWNRFLEIRNDLFYVANLSVQTSRDELVISLEKDTLLERFKEIKKSTLSTMNIISEYNLDKWKGNDWTPAKIDNYLKILRGIKDNDLPNYIRRFHYRPFDFQNLFYFDGFIQVPARDRCEHLYGNESEEFALLLGRSGREIKGEWSLALISSELPDALIVSSRGSSIICPLHTVENLKLNQKSLNVKLQFLMNFLKYYNLTKKKVSLSTDYDLLETQAKSIMFYIYGILYSSNYRKHWQEFLDYDLPRIPFPEQYTLFSDMSSRGKSLADLHMLKPDALMKLDLSKKAHFPVMGSNIVEKIKYIPSTMQLMINKTQMFENVAQEVWDFKIGGYPVIKHWLTQRKTYKLSNEDIAYFETLVAILDYTLTFLIESNDIYDQIENDLSDLKIAGPTLDSFQPKRAKRAKKTESTKRD